MSDNSFAPDLKPYKDIGQFRFWCNKVLPLVYDDSLSYYELLCKVVNYLNDVIANSGVEEENIASLLIAFKELEDYVFEKIDPSWYERIEENIAEVNQKMEALDNLHIAEKFVQLDNKDAELLGLYEQLKGVVEGYDIPNWKNIVNNKLQELEDEDSDLWAAYNELKDYLDNIDFQELINQKLEEMYEEGKLSIVPASPTQLGGIITGNGLVSDTDGTTDVNVGVALEIGVDGAVNIKHDNSLKVNTDDNTLGVVVDEEPSKDSNKPIANKVVAEHIENRVMSENGVHGLRYFGDKLEAQDEDGDYVEIKTGTDIDTELSEESENPVQNKVITKEIKRIGKSVITNSLKPLVGALAPQNGITFTNNGDGTYTLNGTNTGSTDVIFTLTAYSLKANTDYKLVGCPAGGSASTYFLRFQGLGISDYGDGVVINRESDYSSNIRIYVLPGATINATFKPMLTTDLSATYNDFVPYTGGTGQLNGDVAELAKPLEHRQLSNYAHEYFTDKINIININTGNTKLAHGTWTTVGKTDKIPSIEFSVSASSIANGDFIGIARIRTTGDVVVFNSQATDRDYVSCTIIYPY